jgi:hypothetical protein
MKKVLLVLASLVAVAAIMALIRSRSSGEMVPERWAGTAKDMRSSVSDSVKEAASVVKEKAAGATDAIKH